MSLTSFFTDRERAALAWTEALTLMMEGRAQDEVYAEAHRLAIGFRKIPGEYQPHKID